MGIKKKNIKITKQNNKKKSEPYESLSLKQNENFDRSKFIEEENEQSQSDLFVFPV